MSAAVVPSAVLQFVSNNSYPEEDVITADLTPDALTSILDQLRKERDGLKHGIRSLSRSTAPDIDQWISLAKSLQSDILRSRDTARQVVAEYEATRDVQEEVGDTHNKVLLLEREVNFNEVLRETLEHVKHANDVLVSAQNAAIRGRLTRSLECLQEAEASVSRLQNVQHTRVATLMQKRAKQLGDSLEEATSKIWNDLVVFGVEEKRLTIHDRETDNPENTLESVIKVAEVLNIFDRLLQRFVRDFERIVLRPLLLPDRHGMRSQISIQDSSVVSSRQRVDTNAQALFNDLKAVLDLLSTCFPQSVHKRLSQKLMPALISRLEEYWLEPSIPVDISGIEAFDGTINGIVDLKSHVDQSGWTGTEALKEWVDSIPRAWLTKRREIVLGDVRNIVFEGLRNTHAVERVETEMVRKSDEISSHNQGGDDDWNTAWDDGTDDQGAQSKSQASPSQADPADDDDASAWDVDESQDQRSHDDGEGEDAWGWGEEDRRSEKKGPTTRSAADRPSRSPAGPKPEGRKVTLREVYTITEVPDGILEIVQRIISDAEALSSPNFAPSPVSPAAKGLYSLPTLAIAIYRATAPTAYARLITGNMLIYNDASRLSERLRSWQSSQPLASRLRLDNDAEALDVFAKRAYSAEMESQRTILRDLLDGAQGFSNCTEQPFKSACEGAVDQTVDRLRDVYAEWKPILPQSALLQSLGSLVATVVGKMIPDVEDLGDIAESDSQQLRALCDRVSAVKDMFSQVSPDGNVSDMTFIYCPNWLKFQYLSEILESNLADIKYLWNDGELSLEFEAEEVVELIEALFAESDHRRRAIAEIRRSRKR